MNLEQAIPTMVSSSLEPGSFGRRSVYLRAQKECQEQVEPWCFTNRLNALTTRCEPL